MLNTQVNGNTCCYKANRAKVIECLEIAKVVSAKRIATQHKKKKIQNNHGNHRNANLIKIDNETGIH